MLRDDGAIVYLNNVEVFRSNVPAGTVNYLTYASAIVGGADETTTFYGTTVSPSLLTNGLNVLAVEIHQANATSTDLSFDLELAGLGNLPPIVNIASPLNNAIVPAPGNLAIEAAAFDSDGLISRVEFFIEGVKVGEDAAPPFSLQWLNLPSGVYALSVVATDDAGAKSVSPPVNIIVQELLVQGGSAWKYLDDGSNQGIAWCSPAFNDTAWPSGAAQLGFGDGDEFTLVNGGPSTNRIVTTYFRRAFNVTNLSAYTNLKLRVLRDDGAVVYLNNVEVFRSNMPTGTIGYLTYASAAIGGVDETTFVSTNINPSFLVLGTNVLAVEIHQANATSTDLSFDLELIPDVMASTAAPEHRLHRPQYRSFMARQRPRRFHLQSTPNLGPTTWSNTSAQVIASNGLNQTTLAKTSAQEFYRLRKQ